MGFFTQGVCKFGLWEGGGLERGGREGLGRGFGEGLGMAWGGFDFGCGFFAYSWKLPAYSGAFLLTIDNFSFFTHNWSFFAYSFSFLTYS